jgi:hypothetical protein
MPALRASGPEITDARLPAGGYQGQWAGEATAVFLARVPGAVPNPSDPVRANEANPPVISHRILQVPVVTY